MKICPVCSAKFPTKPGLKTHVQTKHPSDFARIYSGNTGAKKALAKRRNNNSAPRGAANVASLTNRVCKGTEVLDVIEIKKGDAPKLLKEYKIAPSTFSGTRLAQEAALWSRWRPRRLVLRVQTSAATIVSGMHMAAWIPSSEEKLDDDIVKLRRRLAIAQPHYQSRAWENGVLNAGAPTVQKWLYVTSTAAEDNFHGKFSIASVAAFSGVDSVSLMTELDWEIEFSEPAI